MYDNLLLIIILEFKYYLPNVAGGFPPVGVPANRPLPGAGSPASGNHYFYSHPHPALHIK